MSSGTEWENPAQSPGNIGHVPIFPFGHDIVEAEHPEVKNK